jgi:hypothetical protein
MRRFRPPQGKDSTHESPRRSAKAGEMGTKTQTAIAFSETLSRPRRSARLRARRDTCRETRTRSRAETRRQSSRRCLGKTHDSRQWKAWEAARRRDRPQEGRCGEGRATSRFHQRAFASEKLRIHGANTEQASFGRQSELKELVVGNADGRRAAANHQSDVDACSLHLVHKAGKVARTREMIRVLEPNPPIDPADAPMRRSRRIKAILEPSPES